MVYDFAGIHIATEKPLDSIEKSCVKYASKAVPDQTISITENDLKYEQRFIHTNERAILENAAFCRKVAELAASFDALFMHNGQSLYNCHAGCTGKPLSIIGLYAKMHHCSNGAAMNALAQFFDADIENSGPFIPAGEAAFLDKNRELLRHMPEKAPGAYALLKTDLEVLYMLMDYAAERAMPFEGGVQISASGRFINSRLSHKVRPSCTLAMLCYCGLLRRLRLDEIPPQQLERLECFSEQQYRRCLERGFDEEAEVYHRCKRRLISQTVLFPYHAPDFYGRLEERAEHWKALGYTKRSFSYREIARRENPFLALDCFPQTENRDKTKEVSDDGVTL